MWWATWWGWMAAALVLAILETLAPVFVLLGFAIGAFLTGLLFLLGISGPEGWFMHGLPVTLVIFALLSLVAWLALHKIFGTRRGNVKIWKRDINDD